MIERARIYQVALFDRVSKFSKIINFEWQDWKPGLVEYWRTGNFECDCNRSLKLYGYDGGEYRLPCNRGENVIIVLWIRTPENELLYYELPHNPRNE